MRELRGLRERVRMGEAREGVPEELKRHILFVANKIGLPQGDISLLRRRLQEVKKLEGIRSEIERASVSLHNFGDYLKNINSVEEIIYLLERLVR